MRAYRSSTGSAATSTRAATTTSSPVHRRAFLGGIAGALGIGIAGCLGSNDSPTVLSPGDLSPAEGGPIPRNGDELPHVELASPLHDRTVATDTFVGERHVLITFVFTRCTMACPLLTTALALVQADAIEHGYEDQIVCMPITFDPEHDEPERLRTFSESVGADPDRESWQFLRPESPEHAEEVLTDTFGIAFQESEPGDDTEMAFVHTSAITIANVDGLVERTYAGQVPEATRVLDDTKAVVEGFD